MSPINTCFYPLSLPPPKDKSSEPKSGHTLQESSLGKWIKPNRKPGQLCLSHLFASFLRMLRTPKANGEKYCLPGW